METKIKDKTKLCWDFGGTKFETIAIMCLLNFLFGTEIRMSKKLLGEDGRVWDVDCWDRSQHI